MSTTPEDLTAAFGRLNELTRRISNRPTCTVSVTVEPKSFPLTPAVMDQAKEQIDFLALVMRIALDGLNAIDDVGATAEDGVQLRAFDPDTFRPTYNVAHV